MMLGSLQLKDTNNESVLLCLLQLEDKNNEFILPRICGRSGLAKGT